MEQFFDSRAIDYVSARPQIDLVDSKHLLTFSLVNGPLVDFSVLMIISFHHSFDSGGHRETPVFCTVNSARSSLGL